MIFTRPVFHAMNAQRRFAFRYPPRLGLAASVQSKCRAAIAAGEDAADEARSGTIPLLLSERAAKSWLFAPATTGMCRPRPGTSSTLLDAQGSRRWHTEDTRGG
jgi:hypothetical protein